jgi:hypothetical protein
MGWTSINFDPDVNILNITGIWAKDSATTTSGWAEGRGLVIRLDATNGAYYDSSIIDAGNRFIKGLQSNDRTLIIKTSSPDYWGDTSPLYTHICALGYNGNPGNGMGVVSQCALISNHSANNLYTEVGAYTGYMFSSNFDGKRFAMINLLFTDAAGVNKLATYNAGYRSDVDLGGASVGFDSSDLDFTTTQSYVSYTNSPMTWPAVIPAVITSVASTATNDTTIDVAFCPISELLNPIQTFETIDGNVSSLPRPAVVVNNILEVGSLRLTGKGMTPPLTSNGSQFDKKGDIRVDAQHIYVCISDYASGNTAIWQRIPLAAW